MTVSEPAERRIIPPPLDGVDDQVFWEYLRAGEVRIQRCSSCGQWRYPPGPTCPDCLSADTGWQRIRGTGTLLAWATFHRRYFPYLPTPYTVAAVTADEGLLVCGGLRVPAGAAPYVGAPARLEMVEAELPDGRPWAIFDWVLFAQDSGGTECGEGGDDA